MPNACDYCGRLAVWSVYATQDPARRLCDIHRAATVAPDAVRPSVSPAESDRSEHDRSQEHDAAGVAGDIAPCLSNGCGTLVMLPAAFCDRCRTRHAQTAVADAVRECGERARLLACTASDWLEPREILLREWVRVLHDAWKLTLVDVDRQ